jgi:predicted ATP-grasp superfamily ATP-dependent carboligase
VNVALVADVEALKLAARASRLTRAVVLIRKKLRRVVDTRAASALVDVGARSL